MLKFHDQSKMNDFHLLIIIARKEPHNIIHFQLPKRGLSLDADFQLVQHEVDTFLHEYSDAEQSRIVSTTYLEDGVVGNLILMIE